MALDLEANGLALAEVDHARVLTWALEDTFTRRGQSLQEERRMLVAAMLGPEQREDRELEVVRLALEQLDDARELSVGETESSMDGLFRDGSQVGHCNGEARRRPPRWERG